jgi:expansin (peptidoglycan-binding protein)
MAGHGGMTGSAGTGGASGAAGRGGTTGSAGLGGASGTAGRGGATGSAGMGGTTGAAGRGGTTGSAGTGGTTGSAGTSGTTGSGGSPPTQCTLQNHSGNGSFTYYWFGQGTARDGNGYRTACGYYGTENGQTDTIENIASMSPASATYFAAIPGQNGFDSKSHCGECVQITGQNGTTITATVIDECPYGSDGGNSACAANAGGHLDLSKAAFDRLGYSVGNPSGTNWKFIPCPVSGNVKVRFKSGNNNEFFVENVITPIASVTVNGTGASRQSYGAWHVGSAISTPATLNLTDMAGRMLSVTLNSGTSNQDTGKQFPACL